MNVAQPPSDPSAGRPVNVFQSETFVMNVHLQAMDSHSVLPAALSAFEPTPSETSGSDMPCPTELLLPARAVVYYAGDAARRIFEVIDGSVILWASLKDGRRQIVQLVKPGETFGFAPGDAYETTAETLQATRLGALPLAAERLSRARQSQLLQQAVHRIGALQAHALLLGRMTALERIATFLVAMLPEPREPTGDVTIELHISRGEIADYLGMTVETVSRNLTKLRKLGIIVIDRPNQILFRDLARLHAAAGDGGRGI